MFKNTSQPEDRATANFIVDRCAERLERPVDNDLDRQFIAKLDRLIHSLESYVDRGARICMISALRVKGELGIKIGDFSEAVTALDQAQKMAERDSSDTAHKARIASKLACARKALGK